MKKIASLIVMSLIFELGYARPFYLGGVDHLNLNELKLRLSKVEGAIRRTKIRIQIRAEELEKDLLLRDENRRVGAIAGFFMMFPSGIWLSNIDQKANGCVVVSSLGEKAIHGFFSGGFGVLGGWFLGIFLPRDRARDEIKEDISDLEYHMKRYQRAKKIIEGEIGDRK